MKSNFCEYFLIFAQVSLTVGKCYRKTLEIRLLYVESHVITIVEPPVNDPQKAKYRWSILGGGCLQEKGLIYGKQIHRN